MEELEETLQQRDAELAHAKVAPKPSAASLEAGPGPQVSGACASSFCSWAAKTSLD